MDENVAIFDRFAQQVIQKGLFPIPYVGPGGGRFNNPPAPHLELCVLTSGCIEKFRVGSLSNRLPLHHLALHTVHFGNRSSYFTGVISSCIFFEVGRDPTFAWLGQRPVSIVFPLRDPAGVVGLLTQINERCLAIHPAGGTYPSGPYAFDPQRDGMDGTPRHILLQAAVLELWGTLLQEVRPPGDPPESTGSVPVTQAETFMRRHYSNPGLTLADIAQSAHLSPDHFGRLFHRETGLTPMHRLRSIRIGHACRLMHQAGLRIREIARHVGFEDPLHFSRLFRAEMGLSPRAYRLFSCQITRK